MLTKEEFPILEFDSNRLAKITPDNWLKEKPAPKACVITFFKEVIQKKLESGALTQLGTFYSETVNLPIYETKYDGCSVGLVNGYVGAATSAGLLEELIASGFEKFIVCGGAGVLQRNIQVGHLVVPSSAVRDEGTSYHYLAPSREVACHPAALATIEKVLLQENISYMKAKTWTTAHGRAEKKSGVTLWICA